MSSFTSASQHYSDYRDMPMVIHNDLACTGGWAKDALDDAINNYVHAQEHFGAPKYEARQLLPNACAVNLLWTVNIRSLLNFFRQRLCSRNVAEMQTVATKILAQVFLYWPELAELCGPYCWMDGKCNQGKMTCGTLWEHPLAPQAKEDVSD